MTSSSTVTTTIAFLAMLLAVAGLYHSFVQPSDTKNLGKGHSIDIGYCKGSGPNFVDIKSITVDGKLKGKETVTINVDIDVVETEYIEKVHVKAKYGFIVVKDEDIQVDQEVTEGPVVGSKTVTLPSFPGGKYSGEIKFYDKDGNDIQCNTFTVHTD